MKRGKSQYSVEFLLTYGWAILAIGIIVAAIYAFGWLDVQNFLPQKCTFYGQVGCRDFQLTSEGLNLSLDNNFGANLYIKYVNITNSPGGSCQTDFNEAIFWPRGSFSFVEAPCGNLDQLPGTRREIIVTLGFFSNQTCSGCVDSAIGSGGCPGSCIYTTTGKIVGRIS